jgi:multidrug resistance efflux pump
MNTWPDPLAQPGRRIAIREGGAMVDLDQAEIDAQRARSEQASIDARNAARQAEREQELAAAISPGVASLRAEVAQLRAEVAEFRARIEGRQG